MKPVVPMLTIFLDSERLWEKSVKIAGAGAVLAVLLVVAGTLGMAVAADSTSGG